MNAAARHAKRRVQWVKDRCGCPVHQDGPRRGKTTHAFRWGQDGEQFVAEVRYLGTSVVTGPWYDESGTVVDAIVTSKPVGPNGEWPFIKDRDRYRVTKRLRRLRAESAAWRKLCRDATRNPNYPPKGYAVALAGWIAAGATVTPDGPVFKARMVER